MRKNIKIRKFILLFLDFCEWVMENLQSKFYLEGVRNPDKIL